MPKMRQDDWNWSQFFKHEEFRDPHGDPDSGLNMNPTFMNWLYDLRIRIAVPIIINPNGGFSSQGHAENSAHYEGRAADIRFPQDFPPAIAAIYLGRSGFHGIGFYPEWKPWPGFHVDLANRPTGVLNWVKAGGVYRYFT